MSLISLYSLTGPFLLISQPILPQHCYLKKRGAANDSKPVGPEQLYFIKSIQHKTIKNSSY